jgi:hypothetical protein
MREWFCCNVHRWQLQKVTFLFWYTALDCFDSINIFNRSDYIASNDRSVNNELERVWKWPCPNVRYYPGICQKEWRKAIKKLQTGQPVYEPKFKSPDLPHIKQESNHLLWSWVILCILNQGLQNIYLTQHTFKLHGTGLLYRNIMKECWWTSVAPNIGSWSRFLLQNLTAHLVKNCPSFMEPEIPLWQR